MSDEVTGAQPSADVIADALGRVAAVRLHEGSAAGTHLPGRRVHGVRVHDGGVEVHVAAVWPTTVDEAAGAVRAALAPLVTGRVDVTIDDVVLDDDPSPEGLGPQGTAPEVSHA